MARVDELRARYEAEMRVAELEEQLLAAKESGPAPRDLKLELRAAREAFRRLRDGEPVPDGVARPATVEVAGGVG